MNETLTTGEKILVFILIAIGSGIIAYATIGRIFGFHRPIRWVSGGHASFTGEMSMGVFVLCCGLAVLHSPVWVILVLPAWVVGFASQTRENRRCLAQEAELRAKNSANYPGVFDNPPPVDIENINEDELDLFDAGSCAYLGKASINDVKVLINRFKDIPEQGPNDIYMLVESLEMIPKDSVSLEFIMLLKKVFEKRDYLVIRWLAPSNRTKGF